MESASERISKTCPLNAKICKNGIRKDFEVDEETGQKVPCRWWLPIIGKDPQSEVVLNQYDCAVPWMVVVQLENSQMQRFTTASVDKLANISHDIKTEVNRLTNGMAEVAYQMQKALEFRQESPSTLEIPDNGKTHLEE